MLFQGISSIRWPLGRCQSYELHGEQLKQFRQPIQDKGLETHLSHNYL
jgi:hypothetical protein